MDKEQQPSSIEPSSEESEANELNVQPSRGLTEHPTQHAIIQEARSFSGPLPPPDMLQGYESVLSGSAERILAMAEKEQVYRLELSASSIRTQNHLKYLGWLSSTLVTSVLLVGGFVLLNNEVSIVGYAALAASAGTLVYAFFQRSPRKSTVKDLSPTED